MCTYYFVSTNIFIHFRNQFYYEISVIIKETPAVSEYMKYSVSSQGSERGVLCVLHSCPGILVYVLALSDYSVEYRSCTYCLDLLK